MTIFGVAGCTGLLVMGLGIRDSLRGITNIQFHDLIKYDLVLSQKDYPTHSAKQKMAAKLDGSAVSQSAAVNYQLLTKKAYNPTNITVIFQFSNINDKKHLQTRRTCKCLTTLLMFQMCSIVT